MTPSGVLGGAADTAAATDATVPSTVSEITAALRDDPILVSEMLGNGATAEVLDALHAKADLAQVPVYVVLTRTPVGLDRASADEEIATLVHAEIGGAGIYYVHTSLGYGFLQTYGDIDPSVENDDTLFSLARYTGLDQVDALITKTYGEDARMAPVAEAGIVLDVASNATIPDHEQPVLTDAQLAGYADPEWSTSTYYYEGDDVEPASVGLSALTGVAVGLVMAAVAFRLVRAAMACGSSSTPAPERSKGSARQKRPKPEPAAPVEAPVEAPDPRARALVAVAKLEDDLESRAASRATPERLRMAIESRDLARTLLEPGGTDVTAPLDVVGAMVVAQTASLAIREPGAAPYRCCFVNPTHGAGRYRADLPGALSVAVCRPCERSLESGTEPTDPLTETRRGRDRPYYAGDTVWARTGFGTLSDELWLDVQRDRGLR